MASANRLRKIIDWFNANEIVDDQYDDLDPAVPTASTPDAPQKRQRAPLTLRHAEEGGMEIRHPRSLEDRYEVGMDLKYRRLVTLDLTRMSDADARHFLDFICGVVFALDATAEKVTDGIYLLAPRGVSVRNNVDDQADPGLTGATSRAGGTREPQTEVFWQGN